MSNNYGEQQYNEAYEWIEKENFSMAEKCLQNAVNEKHPPAYFGLADLYETGGAIFPGKRAKVFELYKNLTVLKPDSYLSMLRMGCMYCEGEEGIPHDPELGERLIKRALTEGIRNKIAFYADDYARAGSIYWKGQTNATGRQFFKEIWGTIKCLSIAISLWNGGQEDFLGNKVRMELLLDTAWEQMNNAKEIVKNWYGNTPTKEDIQQLASEIETMKNDIDALDGIRISFSRDPNEMARECMLALEELQASL
jgi:TPR repeat protein